MTDEFKTTSVLRQGNPLVHTSFGLAKDGVVVTQKEIASNHRFHVYFETIPPKPRELSVSIKGLGVLAIILTVIAVIALVAILTDYSTEKSWGWAAFWAFTIVASWWAFIQFRRDYLIYSQDGGGVSLRANKPSKAAVERFVSDLFAARNAYLKAKYTRFAPDEPMAQRVSKLNYLLAQEAITDAEFDSLSKNLGGGPTTGDRPVGFAAGV